ncbi:MAG: ABC transporter substrate-binding protein, partial [Ktedonobacteraceae bacterium]
MRNQAFFPRSRRFSTLLFLGSALLLLLAACGGNNPGSNSPSTSALASRQVLTFPNVGTPDISVLDPALGPDSNSAVAVGMIYSGLARFDQNLNVVPDQATWTISPDRKVYTFMLKAGLTFSDGTPVTAQTYVYTLTRALLPALSNQGPANLFLGNIVGAADVSGGKTTVLTGVKALNDTTLQITLTQPTEYFLQVIASSISFALNQKVIEQYGQTDWVNHAAGSAFGTGPFMVKEWLRSNK